MTSDARPKSGLSPAEHTPSQDWPMYEAFAFDEDVQLIESVEDVFDRDLDDWLAAQERMNHTFLGDDW